MGKYYRSVLGEGGGVGGRGEDGDRDDGVVLSMGDT